MIVTRVVTKYWDLHALTVIIGLLIVASSCSTDPAGSAEPTDRASTTEHYEFAAVDAGLSGAAVDVTNGVAPFNHESNVDSRLLPRAIERLGMDEWQYLSDCMAAEGFEAAPFVTPRERDDPMLISNWQFPQVDVLAVEGFATLPSYPASPEDFGETSSRAEALREVTRSCGAKTEEEFTGSDHARARELYAMLRVSWEEVLAEIDGSDEVRSAVEGFSVCLGDEGIPVQYTVSETHYLSYVDELRWRADGVVEDEAQILEQYGKLYAECGRELFEAKERLRSGERRVAFLAEHDEGIRELSDLLSGLERDG